MKARTRFTNTATFKIPANSSNRSGILGHLFGVDAQAVVLAAGIGAIAIAIIAVPLSAFLNIWIDEAFTLHSTGAGIPFAWNESLHFEAQPPLYFLLEAAWRTINENSIGFARFPSTVYAATAVAVIVGAAHRIMPRVPPFAIAVVTVANPVVIWAATEMRVYALVFLIGSVLTWAFYSGYLVPHPSRWSQACYVVFAILGLYTQYYIGFFIAAQGLALLLMRRDLFRSFTIAMVPVAAAFLPFIRVAADQVSSSGGFVRQVTVFHVFHQVANVIFVYVLPHDLGWHGAVKLAGFVAAGALCCGLTIICRPMLKKREDQALLVAWLISLTMFVALLAVAGMPVALEHHIIVIAPASLLIGYLLVASLTRHQTWAIGITLAAFAVFASAEWWDSYRPPLAKYGDWQRVAAVLKTDQKTPIAVFPAELSVPLGTYLRAPLVVIPKPMEFTADYVRASTLSNVAEVRRVLEPISVRSDRLWLVTTGVCSAVKLDVYDYHCRYLEEYMDRRYRLLQEISFPGSLARLYEENPARTLISPARHDAK